MHGDISARNVLIADKNIIKIANFGLNEYVILENDDHF